MAIITTDQLSVIGSTITPLQRATIQAKRQQLNEGKRQGRATIFLSHSHDDQAFIEPAIRILEQQGVDVYVDWQDSGMPKHTSGLTAARLKAMIQVNQKFVLLASPTAIKSTWVNWELGIADGMKYLKRMAILPFQTANQGWPNSEYFEMYGRIESDSINTTNPINLSFFVQFPDRTRMTLREWLLTANP